ncbi:MAG: phospholipase D-like domain-containing protein [Aquabacterium sp.]|uniref:phospholipase D-like domain-containing protein n=1 Tax=Aquabacterium sp. TaxID=1872578 RepID=UPI003BB0B116
MRRTFQTLYGICALAGVVLLTACGSLAPRRAQPDAPASTAHLAARVQVATASDDLRRGERARLLNQVQSEGRADLVKRHLTAMTAQERVRLVADNDVHLLVDGPDTFAAMFKSLEAAKRSIWLESYIIEDAEVALRLRDLLIRKRSKGVSVHVIYDAVGSIGTSREFFQSLRDAGVHTCAFNPINPLTRPGYWSINHRDHRKILAVDEQQAFTGGINISKVYSSGSSLFKKQHRPRDGAPQPGWRDTQIRIDGPAAAEMARIVRQTWDAQGCKPAVEPGIVTGADPKGGQKRGDKVLQVIASGPDEKGMDTYVSLLTALDAAQHSIHITMAYFSPGEDMIQALCDAAQRGVQVQLILPSISDFSPVLYAGRAYYQRLLTAGVQLYELDSAVLHAKTAVIDGVWSTVGSSNMDWRSFVSNNEINVVVLGRDFAESMEALFQQDLRVSTPIEPQAWRKRPVFERLKEQGARLFERLM